MIVDIAPPAQELSNRKADSDSFIYAGSTTSFVTVLTEVDEEGAARGSEFGVNSAGDSGVEEESKAAATEESVETTEESVTGNTEGASSEYSDTDDPENEASRLRGATETAREEGPVESPLSNSVPGTGVSVGEEIVEDTTPPAATNSENSSTEEVPPPQVTGGGNSPNLKDSAIVGSTSNSDEALPDDGLTPTSPFPKTLNALLAENTLKQQSADASLIQESTAGTVTAENITETPTDTDSIPARETSPTPQSVATEVGGVRVASQAPAVRIPLTNLPGEIAQQIHLIQQEGSSKMRLRIAPENLGELHLEVHRIGDTIRITMISSSPHVRDALDSQMAELRNALEKQGLELGEANVEDRPNTNDRDARDLAGKGKQPSNTTFVHSRQPPTSSSQIESADTLGASSGLNVLA